jgi:hypothetical protein
MVSRSCPVMNYLRCALQPPTTYVHCYTQDLIFPKTIHEYKESVEHKRESTGCLHRNTVTSQRVSLPNYPLSPLRSEINPSSDSIFNWAEANTYVDDTRRQIVPTRPRTERQLRCWGISHPRKVAQNMRCRARLRRNVACQCRRKMSAGLSPGTQAL